MSYQKKITDRGLFFDGDIILKGNIQSLHNLYNNP